MFKKYRRQLRQYDKSDDDSRSRRAAHDWTMLALEAAGIVCIAITIIITLTNNAENGREMTKAIDKMAAIASTLSKQQANMAVQAHATQKLANTADQQARALRDMAIATRQSAESSKFSAQIADRQIRQNLDLFAKQQRPIMTLDLNAEQNAISPFPGGFIAWKYSFKNVGLGTAFNVTYIEAINVNGGRSQHLWRIGSKLNPPGEGHFSGAVYKLLPGEIVNGQRTKMQLKVRFIYSDALGRRYDDTSCVQYELNAPLRDCSYNPSNLGKNYRVRNSQDLTGFKTPPAPAP